MKKLNALGLLLGAVALAVGLAALLQNPPLGAVPGPNLDSVQWTVNGVETWNFSDKLKTSTTTICSFKTPAATSTLLLATLKLDTSSTTASSVVIAKGATPNASTTLISRADVAANAKATVVASSTTSGADPTHVIAPSQYINFSMLGGTGTFSPVGSCKAVLLVN